MTYLLILAIWFQRVPWCVYPFKNPGHVVMKWYIMDFSSPGLDKSCRSVFFPLPVTLNHSANPDVSFCRDVMLWSERGCVTENKSGHKPEGKRWGSNLKLRALRVRGRMNESSAVMQHAVVLCKTLSEWRSGSRHFSICLYDHAGVLKRNKSQMRQKGREKRQRESYKKVRSGKVAKTRERKSD